LVVLLPPLVISATVAVPVERGISPILAREGAGEEEGWREDGREDGGGREASVGGGEGGAEEGIGSEVGEGLPGSVWSFMRRTMWWSLWRRGMSLSSRSL